MYDHMNNSVIIQNQWHFSFRCHEKYGRMWGQESPLFVRLKDLEIWGNPNDDERVKNHACAAFASHFPFIMCYVFVHNQQSISEFSRPPNGVQAAEIHMAGSLGLFSNSHCWVNAGCFPSACSLHTQMPCPDQLLITPALAGASCIPK